MSTALAGGAGVFGAVAAGATALFGALAPLVGIIALVGAAFIGWKIYDNYMQKQVQAAQEAGNAWKESNSSIEDYKNRVVELRNQLASGTLTESEAYQAKSELLSIQESLTDSYGSQADGIDIVNGSLREQIGLMDQLSQSDANKYLNENQKGINKATKEMEKNRTYYLGQFYDAEGDEASEALKKAIKNSQEKYGDLITTQQGLDGTLQLYFKGDATQAEAALNDFMTDVRNASDELGGNWMLDNIFSYAESGLKSANKVLDKYQEVYEQAKAAEIAGDKTEYKDKSGDSKTAAEWMRDYSQAVKEYNDALASGDSSKIAEAKTNFDAVDKSVQSLLESDMSGYADSFTEISDQLNTAAISANDFKDAVNGIDTSDGAKEIADAAKELKDLKLDDKDFIYAFETDGVQEGEEQINALVQAALDAGVISDTSSESLQSLANMLIELGVVSGEPVEGMEETTVSMSDMRTAAENLVNGLTTVQSVLSSQQNGKSISLADFNSDELADYRGALEYVNGTMQLNAEKVREIAKAKAEEQVATNNTNKALEQAQYLENARQIEQYRQQLQDASFAEGETAESIQASIDALLSENSAIADNCAQYDLLSASIQEAVGAYQNWLNAQGASDYGDMANDTVSAIQQIRDTYDANSDIYGNFGSKKFEAAVDFIVPDSVDSEDLSAIESYMANFKEYLRFDDDGVVEGLDVDKFLQKSVDAGLMSYSEDDGFKVLGGKKMEDFAEGLNLSSGVVQAFFDELQLKGANFDWGDEAVKTIGDLAVEANEAAESLRQMDGNSDLKIKMDVSDLSTTEEQINALDATIAEMDGVKARPDVDASSIDNANAVIQYCLTQKQLLSQPDVMRVDTSQVEGEIGNAISLLQQFQNATNDLEIKQKVGADTSEAESKVNSLASEIEGISPDIKAKLNIDSTSVDSIKTSIAGLSAETINVKANVDASAIDGYNPESKKCDVIYDPKTDLLPESFSSINRTVNYIAKFAGKDGEDGIPGKNGYVHFAYAKSADGKDGFSKSEFTGATYIGVYSDNIQADSGNYKDYAWSLIKGADGKTPVKGVDYFDGVSSYLWIRYATDANGTGMTQTPSSATKYIGTASTTTSTAPTQASAYKWSKYVGENGTAGENGYVHIAYADSADGKTGFDTTVGTDKKYIGQYTDNIEADSTDPSKYTWTLIKGSDVKITSTKVEYIATTEKSTTPPESIELVTSGGLSLVDNSSRTFVTNKWSDTIPDLTDGMYLWTRTTVQYSDGNSTVTYTNAKQGDVGVAGRTYFLEVDTSTVKIDGNNIITPDTIKVRGYYRDGDADREVYPCRFVISKTYSDNRTEEVLSSTGNVAEQSFTIYGESEMPTFYTIEMHKANQTPTDDNMLDIQTIPILVDSSNMLIGARNLLKKSNQLEGCHYYGTDGVYSISEDEVDAKRIIKVKSGTGSNAAKAVYYEVYTDNLVAVELGTKLTVSMNVYSRQSTTINVCLANTNGVMQTTDMQQIQLTSGWNKVYTVLTLEDTEFDLVSDARDNIVTSSGQLISTGSVGITSNVLRITDNMNNNDYYAIDYIQLEKGNRPTDYYPAPEDLTDYTDKITGDMSEELKKIISDVINNVVANRKDFDDLVGEDGRIEEIRKSSVTTQQQVDKVQTDVNTYIVRVDAIDGRIESIEQTTECFSMEDAGLRITRKISSQDPSMQLSMLLSEQKLSFYQGTDEVAYFSNNKLYVTDAEILDRLQLGKFAFIPRSNGNLSFRYLGGQ